MKNCTKWLLRKKNRPAVSEMPGSSEKEIQQRYINWNILPSTYRRIFFIFQLFDSLQALQCKFFCKILKSILQTVIISKIIWILRKSTATWKIIYSNLYIFFVFPSQMIQSFPGVWASFLQSSGTAFCIIFHKKKNSSKIKVQVNKIQTPYFNLYEQKIPNFLFC